VDPLVNLETGLEYKYYPTYAAYSVVQLHPNALRKQKFYFLPAAATSPIK